MTRGVGSALTDLIDAIKSLFRRRGVFEIYTDKKGEWRWRYRDLNFKKILFVSSEGYKQRSDAERCVQRAQQCTHDPIADLTCE
jgi:uncharacterized protein YegP (UPF0339 family)